MIWTYTNELRQACVEQAEWPLAYNNWPKELLKETNCLAFSLGLTLPNMDYDGLVSINPEFPVPRFSEVFERLLTELNLEWRKIDSPMEATCEEYVLQIYGFYRLFRDYHPDFHVIRRELDGTWVHKPDDKKSPCVINFDEFVKEYPASEISGTYAVRKKA